MVKYSKLAAVFLFHFAKSANSANNQNERKLIVGGEEAPLNQYNWFVKIGERAGVLIAPEFFITKASYAEYLDLEGKCRIGALCDDEENCGQDFDDRNIETYFIHPEYAKGGPNLMLVKLSTPSRVAPLSVDPGTLVSSFVTGRDDLFVAGFGTINVEEGLDSDKLLHLDQKFISNEECQSLHAGKESGITITDNVLCARNDDPLKNACYNDGGGPLYDARTDRLVGIVSNGSADCKDLPVVYERIDYQWMKDIVCEEHSEPKPSFCNKQKKYFNIVSKHEHNEGVRLCLMRLHPYIGAKVVIDKCDVEKADRQLWKVDERGQLKPYNKDNLCMRNIRRKKKFAMKRCKKANSLPGFTFVFDPISDSLIWLKSRTNFMAWGLRAISIILRDPDIDDISSYNVYVRRRSNDILQKWNIEYPDLMEV